MNLKIIKIFLFSWIFFYQQVFADQVFFLENRGSVVRDYDETYRRMDALGLGVSNTRIPNGPHRQRLRELRDTILQNSRSLSHSVWSPTASDIEKINQVRRDFEEFQGLASEEHLQGVFDFASRMLRGDTLMVPDTSSPEGSVNGIPNYCENYPVLERDLLQSFYGGAQSGEEFNCYELNGNGVGLDLSDIGATLLSIEEDGYVQEKRDLQNGLIVKAVSGILEESSAYAGIYPGTDNNLSRLKQCARNRAVNNMGTHELRDMVRQHEEELPSTVERLNGAFGEGENARRNALVATQVRQALIIGNLYNISQRAQTQTGGSQVAVVGGSPLDTFSEDVVQECQEQMVREHGFAFSGNDYYDGRENVARCQEYVTQGRYETLQECGRAFVAFRQNIELQTAQRACYYRRSGRADEAPLSIVADNLIPVMTASVDSHPLLFNRDDNRSLIPFVSSESNYVPSDFANLVKGLPGAAQISRAVEEVLASSPDNPREAIELRLAQPDMLELMANAISAAQESEEINNSLKDEITDYQNELGESARNICHDDGRFLHQFPSLVNDVISDELEGVSDPQERERLVARRQAAQCWMLEDEPPENEGGLPGGFFALGVGAIALGMIPGIGWAASAALIAAGTGVAATDSYLRFDHARDQLNATTAAFQGGWADTSLVLERAAARTDAQTMLWAEGLTVGILDVAAPAVRTGVRAMTRTPDEVVEAVNRQARGEVAADYRAPSSPDEIRRTAALAESERIDLIRRLYPELNRSQVDAIMSAHRSIPCPVFNCTIPQLRQKLQIMRDANIPVSIQRSVLRRGIAGTTEDWVRQLDFLVDNQLSALPSTATQLRTIGTEEVIQSISSPAVREVFSLSMGRSHIVSESIASANDLSAVTRNLPGSSTPQRGNLSLSDVEANPDEYVVLYHGTETSGASNILNNGIDLSRGDGEFGRGMYFTTNPEQARAWANQRGGSDSQVVQVILPRSRLQEISRRGQTLEFPRDANPRSHDSSVVTTNSTPEIRTMFTNFVNANSSLRDNPIDDFLDPLSEIDFVAGPTQRHSAEGYDQIKFGDTEASRSLFDYDGDILVRAIE